MHTQQSQPEPDVLRARFTCWLEVLVYRARRKYLSYLALLFGWRDIFINFSRYLRKKGLSRALYKVKASTAPVP